MPKILITGATGQIGTDLTLALRKEFSGSDVIAAGYRQEPSPEVVESGPCCTLDVRDAAALEALMSEHRIDTVIHLASLLSAVAEKRPLEAWDINMNGLLNVLEAARRHHCAVFYPSSIAVFGTRTPADNTPQDTIQHPNTMYGITKVAGELLCDYYYKRHGVNTRGVRFPGIISWKTPPGGGTTDYAVEIFHGAVEAQRYTCFLAADTRLDMMYMPDAVKAIMDLMAVADDRLVHRNGYNITAMNFTPEEIAAEIRRHVPGFTIDYDVDPVRQAIAESWPRQMDDTCAHREWGWSPRYDLPAMVEDMLANLRARH